jgi:hypothetical protein
MDTDFWNFPVDVETSNVRDAPTAANRETKRTESTGPPWPRFPDPQADDFDLELSLVGELPKRFCLSPTRSRMVSTCRSSKVESIRLMSSQTPVGWATTRSSRYAR